MHCAFRFTCAAGSVENKSVRARVRRSTVKECILLFCLLGCDILILYRIRLRRRVALGTAKPAPAKGAVA